MMKKLFEKNVLDLKNRIDAIEKALEDGNITVALNGAPHDFVDIYFNGYTKR